MAIRGCNAPLSAKAPLALKLYGFNLTVFHEPLRTSADLEQEGKPMNLPYVASMSAVRSVSSFTNSFANLGPLLISKTETFCMVISFLFLKSLKTLWSGCERVCWMICSSSRLVSVMVSV
jgi:hypothetical protein